MLDSYCEYADEILRLRATYSLGQGGDRKSKSHGVILIASAGGFQAVLARELGLHPEQARRLMDRAEYVSRLRMAAAGRTVKYLALREGEKREVAFEPHAESRARARQLLNDVIAGDVKPSAAWAGLVGEGRRVAETGKKERAAINHEENIARGLKKLATSLEHWAELKPSGRARLESLWNQLRQAGAIPSTWQ